MTVDRIAFRRCLMGVAGLILVAGCASRPPPRALIVVPSLPVTDSAVVTRPSATNTDIQIKVAVVMLPEQLQHRAVRYHGQVAALDAWPNAVWAERLEVGLTRRLSEAMHRALPNHGWSTSEDTRTQARLLTTIQQLEIDPAAGQLSYVVGWQLMGRQGVAMASGDIRGNREVQIHSAATQAEAIGLWVDALAQTISTQLVQTQATLSTVPQ